MQTNDLVADALTKSLPPRQFEKLVELLFSNWGECRGRMVSSHDDVSSHDHSKIGKRNSRISRTSSSVSSSHGGSKLDESNSKILMFETAVHK